MTVTSTIKNPKELEKALINWYDRNWGIGKKHLLAGNISKILFDNYKQRDTRGQPPKIYRVLNLPNPIKKDHRHRRFKDLQPRRKQGQHHRRQSTALGRGRGGSIRGGGSGRRIISERGRGIHASRGKHATSRREEEKMGLSKVLRNSLFKYWEKNSTDEIWTTWEKVVQHIFIALGHYYGIANEDTNGDPRSNPQ